ncbi:hypothetical protein [Fervidobacterium islandicum]|uniref:hypothetical protein n=1 Tax=Fervidobacterium islandicum TaxID=2423 RepID=UPI003A76BD85
MLKSKRIFFTFLSLVLVIYISLGYSQTNSQSVLTKSVENGISVYNFIEKLAGSRNYDVSASLTFDIMDGQSHKKITFSFDMVVENLENFVFYLKAPEVIKDIVIQYDLISRRVEYKYKNFKSTENISSNVSQVGDVLTSITDFLSTPLFDVVHQSNYVEFKPKNAAILARFGVQPITVRLYTERDLPKKLEILYERTDEKVVLEFKKFIIG